MKRKESDEIRGLTLDGSRVMFTFSRGLRDDLDPISVIKTQIDIYNENMAKLNYKLDQFLIVCVETYRYFNDDGVFVKRETLEEALEVYPAHI